MLRRRPDNTFEFVIVESALETAAPGGLSAERREALRLRIISHIGEQLPAPRRTAAIFGAPSFKSRWVVVPAGVGIGIAVIATLRATQDSASKNGALVARITGS